MTRTLPTRPSGRRPMPHRALACEWLEDRLTPALSIVFDYSLDAGGFFADPAARATLERAGADLAARIDTPLDALVAGGGNTWEARFFNPATGVETTIPNLSVPADTLIVYVGGMNISGSEAGYGGPGGYRASGSSGWLSAVSTRGRTGFSSWGGSITFDTSVNWYKGLDAAVPGGRLDLYSVAVHELGHVLGYGTSSEFSGYLGGGVFSGPTAAAVYGAAPPVNPDTAHWQQGITANGQPVSMQPILNPGVRVPFSDLDFAALRDIGWVVSGLPNVAVPKFATPTVPGEQGIGAGSLAGGPAGGVVVASGPTGGTAQVFRRDGGALAPVGPSVRPFGDFGGAVRAVAADVNGDGTPDLIFGTGPFGGSRIRVLDGKTYTDLTPVFSAFEESFTGGVFLAAGDFDGDGRAEIVVTPDQGGGGRVRVFDLSGGSPRVVADFFGIDDPNFRGGARATVGDVNGDGVPDLIVSAGFGGGPRVAIFDGNSLTSGSPRKLVNDFFAFEPGLRNGVYVTAGDFDGDGTDDLAFGAGPGGGPRVLVVSGAALMLSPAGAVAASLADFFAGTDDQRGGVRVAAKDLDADGLLDLVTGSGEGKIPGELRLYRGIGGGRFAGPETIDPFGSVPLDGVYVG